MAKQKNTEHLSASDIAIILSYLLRMSISASDVYIALLQTELVTKDFTTREWTPTKDKGDKYAEERTYKDRYTDEEKTFYVWHRDVVEMLKQRFEELKIGGNK